MLDNILQIRMPIVCCYAVREGESLYLIDAGFVGGVGAIERALDQDGWHDLTLKGILITHGHLDHTLNAAALAAKYDAWVAAPKADKALLKGDFSGCGIGRVGGWMQQAGASLLNYKRPVDVRWYDPDTRFDFLGGIKVVALPGHTAGHSGFLFGRNLFCGDLFASFAVFSHLPPRVFNENTAVAKTSFLKAAEMGIDGVFPCHCDGASAEIHLERLRKRAGV